MHSQIFQIGAQNGHRHFAKIHIENPFFLMLRINKTLNEFYRAGFISTAISEGIYEALSTGPLSISGIQRKIGAGLDRKGLEAWIDFGVAIGELDKKNDCYQIKSRLSKKLIKPAYFASKK